MDIPTFTPDSICDTPLDRYAADYLYADACPCGAPRVDGVYCQACRTRVEDTPYLLPADMPVEAARPCRACGEAHHIQRCPTIRTLLLAPTVARAMERAA